MNLAAVCHVEESLLNLHPDHREVVKDLAVSIDRMGFINPYYCKQQLWTIMASKRIEIRPELFERMDEFDSLEVWSTTPNSEAGLKFMFAMGSILTKTSYTPEQLATIPWDQLFERDAGSSNAIIQSVQKALMLDETQYDITDWHIVKERRSLRHRAMEVKVKQMSPFKASNGTMGVFGLVRVRPLSS